MDRKAKQNTSLVTSEQQVESASAEDAMLYMVLNGKRLALSWKFTRMALFYFLPEWLRSSKAEPPEPDAQALKAGLNKQATLLMRSAFKNLARPWLPKLLKGLYGPDVTLPHGKDDVLPIIDLMIIDFALNQIYRHPLEITYDETNGIVQNIRPGQRVAEADHAGEPVGRAGTD